MIKLLSRFGFLWVINKKSFRLIKSPSSPKLNVQFQNFKTNFKLYILLCLKRFMEVILYLGRSTF